MRRAGRERGRGHADLLVELSLRHLALPGDLHWGEGGFRWAWQIMAMEKYGQAAFVVADARSGGSWRIAPNDELTPLQARMMATQPDMILAYARHVAERYRRRQGHPVEVRAEVRVSLNGRPHRPLIDPRRDLAALPEDALHTAVLPLDGPLRDR